MNVYDFDKTIYSGDSSVDFFLYCIKKKPSLFLRIPWLLYGMVACKLGFISKINYKEMFFSFLSKFDDIDDVVENFWRIHKCKIKDFYIVQKKDDDVIITASPNFLIEPIGRKMGVKVIATQVDNLSGKFLSPNCKGDEKAKRFMKVYPNAKIDEFYSDSYSDAPMAKLAENAYLVKGNRIREFFD